MSIELIQNYEKLIRLFPVDRCMAMVEYRLQTVFHWFPYIIHDPPIAAGTMGV